MIHDTDYWQAHFLQVSFVESQDNDRLNVMLAKANVYHFITNDRFSMSLAQKKAVEEDHIFISYEILQFKEVLMQHFIDYEL